MTALETAAVRQALAEFDFKRMFIECLGWDHLRIAAIPVEAGGETYTLEPVAQKRGVQIFSCPPGSDGRMPPYAIRQQIERKLTPLVHHHVIVFVDRYAGMQVWQWVKRDPGAPAAYREHAYSTKQSGDALLQKLERVTFPLSAEESLTLPGVVQSLRDAFDKDRVTRKFYDRFKKEHSAFLSFITGLRVQGDREWYASLMLNRLMFVYFIQKKGFLNGDPDYLRNRLTATQAQQGSGEFLSFYRYFLLRLFHEGLGSPAHSPELERLLGRVPYLNGGLFDVHALEEANPDIEIPDEAFETLFDFFDDYHWHLDDRPLRNDREINPDVLGYIFEKYINQKQMGAYYTKEDITEYIGKNTIIPYLFDAAEKKCAVAFQPDGALWRLLREEPDRYIYDSVRKGVDLPLPPEIEVGIGDVAKRGGWNRPAAEEYALPTETWREHVARRQRCLALRERMAAGEIHSINDLITLNLNIRQFAQDTIERCEGPELLRAFWQTLAGRVPERSNETFRPGMSVLDPTCGSGAFLFAALNVLQPLYEACLLRMAGFLEELSRSEKHHPEKYGDFRRTLERMEREHPNQTYFILKTIILTNLYGVDIMREAVEICKLRLFLKLVAQAEAEPSKPNFGIEPLPDIDFNIRAGNTLVGFATLGEVREAVVQSATGQYRLLDADSQTTLQRIDESAAAADRQFKMFRLQQTRLGGDITAADKARLRSSLEELTDELNRYLADTYGVSTSDTFQFKRWLASHQPFHWFIEFYGIIKESGFDVIIGNPPYLDLKELKGYSVVGYASQATGNLYALILERGFSICSRSSRLGYIVPVSSISTDRYEVIQRMFTSRVHHYSSFDDRPSRLFEGIEHVRLTVHLSGLSPTSTPSNSSSSTKYHKWTTVERPTLFDNVQYASASPLIIEGSLPKLSSATEYGILSKLARERRRLAMYYASASSHHIYYSRKIGYFLQILDFQPQVTDGHGRLRPPSEFKRLSFQSQNQTRAALSCLNSSLFYWLVTVFSDCRHLNKREVDSFPIDLDSILKGDACIDLIRLSRTLMESIMENSSMRRMSFSHDVLTVQHIQPRFSKSVIDEIDRVLAAHYGFTEEELDFIINYDIKYRMGRDADDGDVSA